MNKKTAAPSLPEGPAAAIQAEVSATPEQPEKDQRKPWEKSSWTCALATVTNHGMYCPSTGRCPDCPANTAEQHKGDKS